MRTAFLLPLVCLCAPFAACAEPAAGGPDAAWLREVSAFCSAGLRAPGDRGERVVTLIATVEDDVEPTTVTVSGASRKTGQAVSATRRVRIGKVD